MTRKECYDFVKSNPKIKDDFAQCGINYTNMKTEALERMINKFKKSVHYTKPENRACNKYKIDVNLNDIKSDFNPFVDKGARKAIIAIAKFLDIKDIEKNF